MENTVKSYPLAGGVRFHAVQDAKFKHNRIAVCLVLPLAYETAAQNAILPALLRRGSALCPDFTALNERLCELYGASLGGDVIKMGQSQVLMLSISGIDSRFSLENEDLVTECAKLLSEIVSVPNIKNGEFTEQDVALEKQTLIDTIEAEINNKRSYALSRCIAVMCAGEPAALEKYGTAAQVAEITPASAAAAYERVMRTAQVEIFFTGSGDADRAREIFHLAFAGPQREPVAVRPVRLRGSVRSQQWHTERMELTQAKLVMGFRTGRFESLEQYYAMRMMMLVLGGTPFSKLFLNVREKLSLCYYCAARLDRLTGLLMIDSGIEEKNRDAAEREILAQLASIKNGEITDEELDNAKLSVLDSLRSVSDSQHGLESWYLTQVLWGHNISPLREAEYLKAVTREQIVEAAQAVQLDTVYLLAGREEN